MSPPYQVAEGYRERGIRVVGQGYDRAGFTFTFQGWNLFDDQQV